MNTKYRDLLRLVPLLAIGLSAVALMAGCGSSGSTTGGSSESATSAEPSESSEPTGSTESAESSTSTASDVEHLEVGKLNFEMKKYCGEKPTKVGLIDGFGSNTWRVQIRALIEKATKECPNVTEFLYYNANLDPEKYNSTISSWAAQGVNVIITFDDFGQAAVPAYRAAQEQGVKVVTHNAIPGNARIPEDVTAEVIPNFKENANLEVEFLDKAVKGTAKLALIGGPAGNLFDKPQLEAIEEVIEETGADVEVIESEPLAGNWELAKTQQAATALINKDPEVNSVVLTAVFAAPAVNRAFEQAGKPLPTLTGQSSSNEAICEAEENHKKDPNYQAQSLDASVNQAPLAFAKGMAAYQEIEAPELGPTEEPTEAAYAVYLDTLENILPKCVKSLPPGADLSAAMSEKEIEEATK